MVREIICFLVLNDDGVHERKCLYHALFTACSHVLVRFLDSSRETQRRRNVVRNCILENRPNTGTNICTNPCPNLSCVSLELVREISVSTHTYFVQFAVACLRLDGSLEVSSDLVVWRDESGVFGVRECGYSRPGCVFEFGVWFVIHVT